MITKRIDELTYADIERLVEQKVLESRVLDYKRQLPNGTSDEVKELLADVTSFANASGGHLVFGITTAKVEGKNTSIPESIVGVGAINAEEVENRLDAQLRSLIQPRIAGLRIRVISEDGKPTVVVIHIPRSWNAPHMVAKGSSKFYSRTSTGKQPLDVTEIRNAFAMSESVGEKIRAFRDERIGRILAGETPVPICNGALIVAHCIPIDAFMTNETIDLASLDEASKKIALFGNRLGVRRYNLDGILSYSLSTTPPLAVGFLQVFRNGVTEIFDADLIRPSPFEVNGQPYQCFDVFQLENHLIRYFDQVRSTLQTLGICSPSLIFISLLNVRGLFSHTIKQYDPIPSPIDREHLMIPDVLMVDPSISASTFLRPVFDLIWQSCGKMGCPYYDANGKRISYP